MVGRFEQINQVADLTLDETLGVDRITQLLRGYLEQRSFCVQTQARDTESGAPAWQGPSARTTPAPHVGLD